MAHREPGGVDVSSEDTTLDRGSERLSSFKVTRNATGKVQIEVKRYAERNDQEAVNAAVADARRIFDELDAYYAPGGKASAA